ncbi:uncharacterized protein LOC136041536, partial [Artemia franciscana]|uniref:uncharacterized protein LOC136041536 n=1 Tax=Artemia franciscana TaxID=6661 RepID=UPI0032DB0DA3
MDEMASGDESITATNSSGSSASAKAPVQPVAPTKYSGLTPKPLVDTRNQSYMPPPTQAAVKRKREADETQEPVTQTSESIQRKAVSRRPLLNSLLLRPKAGKSSKSGRNMAGPKRGRGDKASAQAPEKVEGEPEIKVLKSEEDVKEETPKEEQISSETDQAASRSGSSASAKAPVQPVAPTKYSGLTPKPLVDTPNQSYMPPPTQAAECSDEHLGNIYQNRRLNEELQYQIAYETTFENLSLIFNKQLKDPGYISETWMYRIKNEWHQMRFKIEEKEKEEKRKEEEEKKK